MVRFNYSIQYRIIKPFELLTDRPTCLRTHPLIGSPSNWPKTVIFKTHFFSTFHFPKWDNRYSNLKFDSNVWHGFEFRAQLRPRERIIITARSDDKIKQCFVCMLLCTLLCHYIGCSVRQSIDDAFYFCNIIINYLMPPSRYLWLYLCEFCIKRVRILIPRNGQKMVKRVWRNTTPVCLISLG